MGNINTQSEITYINTEIVTYMTNNKLLAFKDKLNPAFPVNYANIHANKEEGEDGRRIYSKVGILASDFSKGKGENNIKVEVNISASEAAYIFEMVRRGLWKLNGSIFSSEKIFGNPNEEGRASMSRLSISRIAKDKEGNDRKSPWCVVVENGSGIKVQNSNGSAYAKGGSFVSKGKVIVYLTDQDFFCMMKDVCSYINIWELTFGPKVVREGRALFDRAKADVQLYQEQPQSVQQQYQKPSNQAGNGNMSISEARMVVVDIGNNKGKTLGQIEAIKLEDVAWYAEKYTGSNKTLKKAARIILEHSLKAS